MCSVLEDITNLRVTDENLNSMLIAQIDVGIGLLERRSRCRMLTEELSAVDN